MDVVAELVAQGPAASNFIVKETLVKVFSCEPCDTL